MFIFSFPLLSYDLSEKKFSAVSIKYNTQHVGCCADLISNKESDFTDIIREVYK